MSTSTIPPSTQNGDQPGRRRVVVDTSDGSERFLKGSARMFESDFLEKFSHVHPAVPAILYVPVAVAAVVLAFVNHTEATTPARLALQIALQVLAGYVAWTLFEYWLHRLVFHLPVVGPKTARAYFLIHGVHHDWPWDTSRLLIPPGASLFLCAMTFGVFRLLFGAPAMYGYFAGFVAGYVFYDTAHWYVHARVPRSRFGRWLRREHMIHHFKANTSRFGVSCPWWDHVFRTTGAPGADTTTDASAPSGARAA